MSEAQVRRPQRSPWSLVAEMVMGAGLGAAATWGYFSHAHVARWADAVAIGVALVCSIAATRIFTRSLDAKRLGELMAVEGESTPRETGQAPLQALLLLLLAIVMVWPPLMTMNHWPAPPWSYAVIAAFLIARIVYTDHVFRKGDEFVRQRVRDAAWRAFFVGQTLLMAYAGGERLGLWAPINSWDVLVVLTALSIFLPALDQQRKVEA